MVGGEGQEQQFYNFQLSLFGAHAGLSTPNFLTRGISYIDHLRT
jgi:hypothetical protein